MTANPKYVSDFIQLVLQARKIKRVEAVPAAEWLDRAGVLPDSEQKPGKPLRILLRKGLIAGGKQEGSNRWWIYHAGEAENPRPATRVAGAIRKRAVKHRGPWRAISVTFETTAQRHSDGQFSVPKRVCSLLELDSEDDIALVLESDSGALCTTKKLASGLEIYGKDIAAIVKAGEAIRVTAMRPGAGRAGERPGPGGRSGFDTNKSGGLQWRSARPTASTR